MFGRLLVGKALALYACWSSAQESGSVSNRPCQFDIKELLVKKVFSLALTVVALVGILQITAAPAEALPHCEECCYEWYEECLIAVGMPGPCANVLNNCLADCEE